MYNVLHASERSQRSWRRRRVSSVERSFGRASIPPVYQITARTQRGRVRTRSCSLRILRSFAQRSRRQMFAHLARVQTARQATGTPHSATPLSICLSFSSSRKAILPQRLALLLVNCRATRFVQSTIYTTFCLVIIIIIDTLALT